MNDDSKSFILDSWALMALLDQENPAIERVRELLYQAGNGEISLFLSVINLGEIFYSFGRQRGENVAIAAVAKIKNLPLHILPIDESSVLAAARYKMINRISYADAFAVAAAVDLDAKLVTGDPEFLSLSDQVHLELLTRN
jgi:ribonuclease VapC